MKKKKTDENQLAKHTERLLAGDHPGPNPDPADRQVAELGKLLRETATSQMPAANQELRRRVVTELETQSPVKEPAKTHGVGRFHNPQRTRWAVAALVLLGLGIGSLILLSRPGLESLSQSTLKYQQLADSNESLPETAANDSRLGVLASQGERSLIGDGETSGESPAPVDYFGVAANGKSSPTPPRELGPNGEVTSTTLALSNAQSVLNVPDQGTVLLGGIKRKSERSGQDRNLYSLSQSRANQPGGQSGVKENESITFDVPDRSGGTGGIVADQLNLHENSLPHRGDNLRAGGGTGGAGGVERDSAGEHLYRYDDWANQRARRQKFPESIMDGRPRISGAEQYEPIVENPFQRTLGSAAVSTFSIDVDTASYANIRRFISRGQLPPPDSVRIEEMINYFEYDYPQPNNDHPFSVNMELASCPWNPKHRLLRVGLKGKEVHRDERPRTNLVFLLDVSGSMNNPDKLPLLKRGFQMMVNRLTENDRVSIVTYAGNAGLALEPTSGDQKKQINEAIERLTPGGSTHGSAGIQLAYQLAQQNFIQDGVNKVILATDGDLNVGITSDDALVQLITQKASEGVFLTVLGFGTGNLKDGKLEKLADNGNGLYAYIDSLREAHKVLVEQMSGSLVTIAKDVKIQIEFNPAEVKSYRLIGYENRMLARQDFDNDQKDAGEIGAGHTVTALYELATTGQLDDFVDVKGLKYQGSGRTPDAELESADGSVLTQAAANGELLTLALRYKQPDENESKRIEFTLKDDEKSFSSASDDFRFAASVASFGMLLRGSKHAGNSNLASIMETAAGAIGNDVSGYRAEFVELVRQAGKLVRH